MASSSDSISIKELASKLKVTDALLKKIIKDFDIETLRNQKRIHLSDESERTIREILALRASGKKNQEIKELFDASKAEQVVNTKPKQKEEKIVDANEAEEDTAEIVAEETETKTTEEAPPRFEKRDKFNKKNRFKDRREKFKQQKQNAKAGEEQGENLQEAQEDEDTIDLASYLDESEDAETTMSMHLSEDQGSDSDLDDLDDEDFAEDDEDEFDATEAVEGFDKKISPRKVRRRQFSFRYIQRQIANDSKRIHYIKQKLKRGRLSTKEKMNLEESLEQRSKLLSGWVHLLRWVKS